MVAATRGSDKNTKRTVKYRTIDWRGDKVQYVLLDEALKHVGRAASEHYGDWTTSLKLEIISTRDFTPAAMKMNIEDVINIHEGPGCLRRLLTPELRDKYFEEVVETNTRWNRKKVVR